MPKSPTAEELEANVQKSVEEAEKLSQTQPDKQSGDEDVPEEKPEEQQKTQENQEEKPTEDYKKKFIESSREAQILHAKNKKVNEALERALNMEDPDDKELISQYSDWDTMTDFEKRMAKSDLKNSRRFEALEEITRENKDLEVWREKIDSFVDDPKSLADYPQLDGREDEFKLFATKPTRRGVDFEDLVAAFSYAHESTKKTSKGQMFESGSGGPANKAKPKKMSIMDARALRESDYSKYLEMLRAGKIEENEF